MSLHNQVGDLGEQLIAAHLAQAGRVEPSRVADLSFAGGIEVEVKTSRATLYNGKNRGYQFLLRSPGHSNFRKADVLVLVCINDSFEPVATYVMPTALLRDRKKLTIPLNLNTPFVVYKNRWEVIAEIVVGNTTDGRNGR